MTSLTVSVQPRPCPPPRRPPCCLPSPLAHLVPAAAAGRVRPLRGHQPQGHQRRGQKQQHRRRQRASWRRPPERAGNPARRARRGLFKALCHGPIGPQSSTALNHCYSARERLVAAEGGLSVSVLLLPLSILLGMVAYQFSQRFKRYLTVHQILFGGGGVGWCGGGLRVVDIVLNRHTALSCHSYRNRE